MELQSRVLNMDVGGASIHIPLERVLSQLSRGSVKISFGELRQLVPQVFSPEPDKDKVAVPLPLGELLSRINPALISRRRVQKQVEVPPDISSPFENGNFGFQNAPAKPEPAPAPVQQPRANPIPFGAPTPPAGRSALTSTPTPQPPSAPALPPTMVPPSRGFNDLGNHQPPPPAAPTPPPAHAAPAAAPLIPMSQKPRTAPGQPPGSTPVIVSLIAVAEGWPEAVRKEIVQLNLVEAKVHLPADAVEQGLKQGKIAFTWKTIRSWMPGLILPTSPQDATMLDLPLKVVAPAFLGRQKETGKQQNKVAIDSEIPNLFFGFPQPNAPAPAPDAGAVSKPVPVDTNYYVWDDTDDRVAGDPAKQSSPGTSFVTRYATPNEVVSRAGSLDGVAGALIALPDGLMVASRLSPDLNGDTLAAFLPHIFSKVSQCTKELRMGELNNLNFTVGNVPWKIFRVNAIFFAAFGRPGEPLPTASLASLAAELDHKAQ
jgi:predicted regulator of Ras-like GTPase activity (Roadblock/LC7/MglB family)